MSHLLRTIAPPLHFCTSAPHQHLSTSYLCTSAEPPCTSAPPLLNRNLILHPSTSPAPVQTPAQTPAPAPVILILCTYSGSTSVPQHLFTSVPLHSAPLHVLCSTSTEPLQNLCSLQNLCTSTCSSASPPQHLCRNYHLLQNQYLSAEPLHPLSTSAHLCTFTYAPPLHPLRTTSAPPHSEPSHYAPPLHHLCTTSETFNSAKPLHLLCTTTPLRIF